MEHHLRIQQQLQQEQHDSFLQAAAAAAEGHKINGHFLANSPAAIAAAQLSLGQVHSYLTIK